MSVDETTDTLPCVRCRTPLTFAGEQDFREGAGTNLLFGFVGALFESSTRLEVWVCESCGHVELFVPSIGN